MANPTMVLISSQTITTTTASVTFSSIPNTYTDLKVLCTSRLDNLSGNYGIRFNGDTGANYNWRYLAGQGASVSSGLLSNNTEGVFGQCDGTAETSNTFSISELYIPNYASSNQKSFLADGIRENNATTAVQIFDAGLWTGTAAITSMTIRPYAGNGNFVQYSSFYLYGIKNS